MIFLCNFDIIINKSCLNKNKRYILYLKTFLILIFFFYAFAGLSQINPLKKNISNRANISVNPDTLSTQKAGQSRQDTVKPGDNVLEYELFKSAKQYQLIDRKNNLIILYDEAKIKYGNIELEAGIIVLDNKKNEIYAGRIPDSTGKLTQRPRFREGNTETVNDSIRFNFKTKKALVWNTFTKDGEISLISEVTKKVNDSVNFFKDLKITTAEDIYDPEYYILAKKGKIVPGKKIVVGTSIMYIEDIPTPLILPFGYFPLLNKRTSGFIIPTWNESERGFGIQNTGFYLVLSKYADLSLLTDIYTNGSFAVKLGSNYKKRYAYSGRLSFRTEKIILGEPGTPDYVRTNVWNLTWQHTKDPKSNPNYNFSSNVNIGSSKYYRTSFNQQNIPHVLNNTFNSSINFSKRFRFIPSSGSISVTHNQNVNTEQMTLTLPQFYYKIDRIYPFAPKSGIKKNLLHKLNFDYTFNASNRIETTDQYFLKKEMWDAAHWGLSQKIPLATNFKLFKYFNFTPSASIRQVTYGQRKIKYWDASANNGNGAVVDTLIKKPVSFTDWNVNINMNTTIYGIFKFGKGKLKAVRHVMSPSIGYGYVPSADKHIRYYQASNDPNDLREYTYFEGGMYGQPGLTPKSFLNFSLSNTFEAKIQGKDGKDKKIALIKNLNLSSYYNFNADSLKLGLINMSGSIEPVKGLPLRITGLWDPYAVDSTGKTINAYAYKTGQGLVRLKNVRVSTSFSLDNNKIRKWLGWDDAGGEKTDFIGNKTSSQEPKEEEIEDSAYRYPVKWRLNISYNFTYSNKKYQPGNPNFKPVSPHTINFNGNIEFSPGWNLGINSGYDLVKKGLSYTVLNFRRDLKSWYMTFTWRPLPPYTSWYFYIGIKSSVLKDIKYEKRKENFNRFF
jgi:lipopolysaccharide assembly outer membrane protein LptD (OstA)